MEQQTCDQNPHAGLYISITLHPLNHVGGKAVSVRRLRLRERVKAKAHSWLSGNASVRARALVPLSRSLSGSGCLCFILQDGDESGRTREAMGSSQ